VKRKARYRPSPAMAVAIAALAVALGGAAFAALPGSDGAIHACYHKSTGALRVVDAADACRNGEQAIAWNQRGQPGPPGTQVVARLRAGSFQTEPGTFKAVPLSPDSWTQREGEFQVLHVEMRLAEPFCPVGLHLRLDGELTGGSFLLAPFGSPGPRDFVQIPLFEPDAPVTHTLSVEARADNLCPPDSHAGLLEYVKANVVSYE
jgi:hypothetical protein